MATPAKQQGNKTPLPSGGGKEGKDNGIAAADAKLLAYIRNNAQRIVAGIQYASSRAGEQQR